MIHAFVFGKFLPFHLGHKALIDFALEQCDRLSVLVCAGQLETIEAKTRANWISDTYPAAKQINIIELPYDENELPNTSVSSREVSKIWAQKFKELLPDTDLLITSEPYGEFVAGFMGIRHILFDQERTGMPVSATDIRKDVYHNWHFLPDAVKPFFQKKIAILGTESTGKSTLTEKLHRQFNSSIVREAGREVVADSNSFDKEDLLLIAVKHAEYIKSAEAERQPFIFMDTDIHITQSYAKFRFGEYLQLPENIYETNRADLYLYLDPNVPYLQDGTRLAEAERNQLDEMHRETLSFFGIKFEHITGNWEERFKQARQQINLLKTLNL
ncbi:MAG: AAA family ATPase [Lewinellaceae bacterium]|nr:AAA family ATPase [Lewinellaceae bacterium]